VTALAATIDQPAATLASGKGWHPAVGVETCSLRHGRPAVIPTPDTELTRQWADALFGFKLSPPAAPPTI